MLAAKIKNKIILIIGGIIAVLVSALVFSLISIEKLDNNLKMQVQTRTTIIALKDNLTFLLDAETGERGYCLTNDSNYLKPYYAALHNISVNRAQLRKLVDSNIV